MRLGIRIGKSNNKAGDVRLLTHSEARQGTKFLQTLYEFFRDEDDSVNFNIGYGKLPKLEGYPDGADIENAEFLGLDGDKAWFTVFGDWQDEVNFAVTLRNGKLVITNKFDANAPGYDQARINRDKETIETAGSMNIKKSFGESFGGWDDIQKAIVYKYIRRVPKKSGKGFWYVYAETFKKPFAALKTIFAVKKEKIDADFDKHNIKKDYGADKKTFAAHILEYLSNKLKWNNIFSTKENRAKYKKPEKQATAGASSVNDDTPGPANKKAPAKEKEQPLVVNRSLMRKVWEIYNPQQAQAAEAEDKKTVDEKAQTGDSFIKEHIHITGVDFGGTENGEKEDQSGTGSKELPADTPAVRDGGSENTGDPDVSSPGTGDNAGESGRAADESGGGSGGGIRGRRGRSAIKEIREKVKKLLAEKADDEFTEADKELLRQYEGGGGLAEKGATNHGTLYEFYTPQKVVDKVWALVDKYNPRTDKTVIEPSAGTGRFAENRLEKFDLFELDETSARIAGILHPDANVKQGYFQELFMNGRTPKKTYDGKKYDVAIGNPPYGEYSGLHRGLGEGKDHSKIDEYFIDRSLDTLKDGGILAMVVPSSFLRSKSYKGKERIAGKARLLEAWRLPNGTFGTTGIGTDIIVLRKEPGDPEQFNNNAYFDTHENQIVGDEGDKLGRFGMEKYVSLPDGMTFDEALDSINPGKIPVIQTGEISPEVQAAAEVTVSEAEEHKNRSDAMMGNDNAYKGGPDEEFKEGDKVKLILPGGRKKVVTITGKTSSKVTVSDAFGNKKTVSITEIEKTGSAAGGDIKTRIKDLNDKIRKLEKDRKDDLRMAQTQDKLDEDILAWQLRETAKAKEKQIEDLTKQKSELEAELNRSEAMKGNDNAAGDRGGENEKTKKKKKGDTDDYTRSIGKNMTVDQYNEKYGIKVDKADMPIWAVTDYAGRIDVARLTPDQQKHMKDCGRFTIDADGIWYSIANYASGNIYEKLDQLERDKEKIGEKNYKFNKSLLEAAKLPPKTVEQIHFSPINDFVKEYRLTDEEGNESTLQAAFKSWARVGRMGWGRNAYEGWDQDSSPISAFEIPSNISFNDVIEYINQKAVRSDKATRDDFDSETARMEAAKKRDARRECAERLFNRFIQEGMPEDQRAKLVGAYNRRFFAVVNPDYSKVPVFIDGMNTHKGEKIFDLIKEQADTISFMCNKGNGISVADVGVGKTVIGEAVTVNQIKTKRAKRPLVCVPKAVYSKWIKEFHQHFPGMVINELGNFSDKNIARFKNDKGGLNIPKGTISVCTYEALEKVTFKDETINTSLVDDMMDSQTIYDAEAKEKRTAKELEEEKNKIMTKLGKGAKAKEGAICWEDTGFDCITVDEIHNFKNVFGEARSFNTSNKDSEGKERQANEFSGLKGSRPSDCAVKLFAITQLIQKQNNGQNVFGLSATPFTNSPIEVYNILSLVARNKLKELHLFNMHAFLAMFAEVKSEWSVMASGEVKEKQVMKRWRNLGALQTLISEFMYRVDAEEAGVVRPRRRPHRPELELSPLQKAIIAAEIQYMSDADPKKDPGAALKAINYMRMATVSPAAVNEERIKFYQSEYSSFFKGLKFPSKKEFVASSPKLQFTCDVTSKIYKRNSSLGQYIYLPRGVEDFTHVKQYLIDHGVPSDAIAFMSSATTLDEKERIKDEFNDVNGKIKVIIGSETIKEGVSLNGNTAVGHNCMLGWNPTETTQVEGRGWRQGNKQGHFHMVYPLMADSIDSFMYQKYDEKKSRIDEVWSYKGDTSRDVSDINPEELKFELIKDPAKKAGMIIGQKKDKIKSDIRIEEARYEVLYKDSQLYEKADKHLPEQKRKVDETEADMLECRNERDEAQKEFDKAKTKAQSKPTDREAIRDKNEAEQNLANKKWQLERATSEWRSEKKRLKLTQDTLDRIGTKFQKLDIKPENIDEKLKEVAAGIQKLKKDEESVVSSYSVELERAKAEMEARRKKIPPLNVLVDEMVETIMGDLRPMDDKLKAEIRAENEAKRATVAKSFFVIANGRLLIKA